MDNLQHYLYINELLALYGTVLTKRQLLIMEDYYKYNLSIIEIAAQREISKAAVSDAIKVATKKLSELERKIGFRAYVVKTTKVMQAALSYELDETLKKELVALLEEKENGI